MEKPAPQMTIFTNLLQAWQGPSAYWQTVAGIMNQRGQTADALFGLQLQALQKFASCRSWADYVGACSQLQAQCVLQFTELTVHTQQQRQNLWQTWQLLATRQAPSNLFSQWSAGLPHTAQAQPTVSTSKAEVKSSVAQPAATAAPNPSRVNVPTVPAATIKPETKLERLPLPEAAPAVSAPQTQAKLQAEQSTAMPVAETVSTAPSSPQPLPFPTISRTGDASVVRSGTGATIAAAAATRRSVIARRSQRKTRLARAR